MFGLAGDGGDQGGVGCVGGGITGLGALVEQREPFVGAERVAKQLVRGGHVPALGSHQGCR